jgi:myosin heavy subunit
MESNPNRSGSRTTGPLLAALIIMTGLAGTAGYLYFDQKKIAQNEETIIAERVEELSTTRVKLDSISTALDSKIAEVQKLGGNVDELMKVKADLEADRANLRRGQRMNSAQMAKYGAKIKEYEAFLVQRDTMIAQLQREKGELVVVNQGLNEENTGLKTQRQVLKDSVSLVVNQNKEVVSQNQELATKVTRASALKAQNVKVLALNSRGKERDEDAFKAKRIDKLKLVYTLLDNPLTKEEPKDVYVRLLDPDGAIVSDMANGSGTFTVDGNETVYTTKQTVDYDNEGKKVELTYARGIRYKPGKYTVELYAEGFKIGKGEFAVR